VGIMKISAGIAGILLGIFSLTYVGLFGSMIGTGAGWLGSMGPQGNLISNWAGMVSTLSWLAPLLAIIGGIVTFSKPSAGGVLLAASAYLHWHLLGFGQVGKLFVLPIGATAALALFASSLTRSATNLGAVQTSTETPSLNNTAGPGFDRAKWNALLQYDKDIALIAERLQPLGQKWLDEFASSYLALNDKQYLPSIEQKIVAAAKVEAEENEQAKIRLEEKRKASLQEQERLALERKRKLQLRRERLWGNRRAKIRTITTGSAVFLVVALITGGVLVRRNAEQHKVARTALFLQAVNRDDWAQVRELVEKGVDVNAQAGEYTPLVLAIIRSNGGNKASLDAAISLIKHGARVNVSSGLGLTPLHFAANPTIVSLLLSRGATVDAKDNDGATPLFRAACGGSEKVNQLIASRADVNMKMNNGDTPLHNAAFCNSLPAVKALIEHGAQVNVTNQEGKTPLDSSIGHLEIGAYLKAHGATGEIPVQLAVLTEQRRKPVYESAFLSLFSGRFDTPPWLSESGYGGVESYGRMVTIEGTKYEYYSVCRPHDCYGNFLYVLFTPGGGTAWALTTENQGNFRFYGNPDQGLQAFMTSEAQRNL
jgi:ankyrin repeat protein